MKQRMTLVVRFVLLAAAIVGSSATCGAKIKTRSGSGSEARIPADNLVCVMVGPDATYKDTLYAGSGKVVADYVLGVVRQTRPSAVLVQPRDPAAVSTEASDAGCVYVIVSTITRWEDIPQLTGPDHVEIVLHLMRLDSWTVVRSVTFAQHSGNARVRDQPASEILNDGFDVAVRELLPPASAVKAIKLPS